MENESLLMMPGPVPMPERVRLAMARQAINHRGAEFGEIMDGLSVMLKEIFCTENDVLLITGSGTAGMEAAISNFCRDRTVVSLANGKFGDRLYRIAQRYTDRATLLAAEDWGRPLPLTALETALDEGVDVVTMVHNETSAGIMNPAEEVGKLAKKHGALFIMDGITSIGADVVLPDKWGVDVAVMGSQKCLAAPAGLAGVSVSEKAWEMQCENPPFYFDLPAYKKNAAKLMTPYTPAVPLFLALHEACKIVLEEGMEARITRHRMLAAACRAAVAEWGLEMYPTFDDLHAYSNTATAVKYPEGITDADVRGKVKSMGVEFAGGQDHLKGRIFRIGTMGATNAPELLGTLAMIQGALSAAGCTPKGDGVSAACEVLFE
ncbi:MAG TPA: alanine--glyoxylate aminotransferase family protein [Methanoculleus sp.]|nr:alanine--glyoxylate aminotransferase family protein [Methanoculleus sp.]